ncbi:aminotransferase class IV [Streptomyces sp. NBC_01190]|uniref:aminotransferase class IV n=1 Tax=Streptomyces sp. NBC_01190 TaxID=2903767 RepID=UPI00386F8409|nr:aminotransferase class IV [Streptomyces sp. NBC_01190]
MTRDPASPLIEIDGEAATVATLAPALGGYGHFTAMQVRDGRVRGVGFHLARLDAATRELFGAELDGERVRAFVRHALGSAGRTDASVRVYVFPSDDAPGAPVAVMVKVGAPAHAAGGPYRLKSVPYQRPVAHLKHLGGFAQRYHVRQVEAEGYHEALLTGPDGTIAEGAVTNVGFIEGDTVVWPEAPLLRGVTLQVLERRLGEAGIAQTSRPVRLADIPGYQGVFVGNSRGVVPVESVDATSVPTGAELLKRIGEVYESAPWDAL